jgi:hypothetical protein
MFSCCYSNSKYKKDVQVSDIMNIVDDINSKRMKVRKPRLHFLLRRGSMRQINFLFEQGHDLNDKNIDFHLRHTSEDKVSP